jgi:hypothetical protein
VQANDGANDFQQELTVTVADVNERPTEIGLLPASIIENTDTSSSDVLVGLLTTEDPDDDNAFSYTLEVGDGDADNGTFVISGDQLLVRQGTSLDYETQDTYSIRVQVNDEVHDYPQTLTVTVTDVVEQPWQNPTNWADVNADGSVTAKDVLAIVNDLNLNGSRALTPPQDPDLPPPYVDPSGNNIVEPEDAMIVINYVNNLPSAKSPEGEFRSAERTSVLSAPRTTGESAAREEPESLAEPFLDLWRPSPLNEISSHGHANHAGSPATPVLRRDGSTAMERAHRYQPAPQTLLQARRCSGDAIGTVFSHLAEFRLDSEELDGALELVASDVARFSRIPN